MDKDSKKQITRDDLFPKQEEPGDIPENQLIAEKRSRNKVLIYVVILFSVAFLLMLMSYLMNERDNRAALSDLTETHRSVTESAFEDIDDLQTENDSLNRVVANYQIQLADAEDTIEQLEDENSLLQDENLTLTQQLEQQEMTGKAMDILLQLSAADGQSDEETCLELIALMERENLSELLPHDSEYDVSPAEMYESICEKYQGENDPA